MTSDAGAAAGHVRQSRKWFLLSAAGLVLLLINIDLTAVTVALHDLRAEFDMSLSELQWVISAFFVTYAAFVVVGGRGGDIWGRRRLLVAGAVCFGVASVAAAAAQNGTWLIIARAAQGVTVAIMAPNALALIVAGFPERARGEALGFMTTGFAAGAAIGAVVGGALTEYASWRWIFIVDIPVVVAIVVVARLGIAESRGTDSVKLDIAGAALCAAGIASAVIALDLIGSRGWTSPVTIVGLIAAIALFAILWAVERRARHPLIDPALLRIRAYVTVNTVSFLLYGAYLGYFVFIALFLQGVLGFSTLTAGIVIVIQTTGVAIGGLAAGRLISHVSQRLLLTSASAILCVGLLACAAGAWIDSRVVIYTSLVLVGLGIGASLTLINTIGLNAAGEGRAGAAAGVIRMLRLLGGALGVALATVLFKTILHGILSQALADIGVRADVGTVNVLEGLASRTASASAVLSRFPAHFTQQIDAAAVEAYGQAFAETTALLAAVVAVAALVSGLLLRKAEGDLPSRL